MLDIKLIRQNPKEVRENLARRGNPEKLKLLDELIEADAQWRRLTQQVDELRKQRNVLSRQVAELKKGNKDTSTTLKQVESIPEQIKDLDSKVEKYSLRTQEILKRLPNLLHESVPLGKDEKDNVEIRRWGTPPKFSFPPKNHLEIALGLNLIDPERAAKVAGAGFVYLRDKLVLLDHAILSFALDFLVGRGFVAIEPPFMMNRAAYEGVTDLADFESVMYKIDGEDLYLIATSEHPMAAMLQNEVLLKDELPHKFVGISPCFRREVGAHGKYTKGLFRMHQFNKIEQFVFSMPEDSWRLHEEIQENCELLYQKLELPYRVVNCCSGELGAVGAKRYDTEFWMADGNYREIGSNSNCTDFQARSLGIRYREGEGKPPAGYVHTLNNTALATSRTMVAILEVHQQEDGTVRVPKALQPYLGGTDVITRTE
jgi:seryl-tRNA synthetase